MYSWNLLSSLVVGAVLTGLFTEIPDHVVAKLLGQGAENLELLLGHVVQLLGLCLELVAQAPGLLDLHQSMAMLPRELLERLLDVVLGHRLLLSAVHLHVIDPEPVWLHLLVPLLGGVAGVSNVGGDALGRAVLETDMEAAVGLLGR